MISAMEQAILAQLRKEVADGGYGLTIKNSGEAATPDGQPPPMAGQLWVSVYVGAVRAQQESSSEDEYQARVTISLRIDVPWDRIGPVTLQKARYGINDRVDAIKAILINHQYTIMNAANALINAAEPGVRDGFVEPFLQVDCGDAELTSGDWFHAEPETCAAARKTINLRGARRIQVIGNVA